LTVDPNLSHGYATLLAHYPFGFNTLRVEIGRLQEVSSERVAALEL
jgi:hypothetical protein